MDPWSRRFHTLQSNYSHAPQLLGPHFKAWKPQTTATEPVHLESVLLHKRNHPNEKAMHHNEEKPPMTTTRESPCAAVKTQAAKIHIHTYI